jgi:uncharacterized membrane protein
MARSVNASSYNNSNLHNMNSQHFTSLFIIITIVSHIHCKVMSIITEWLNLILSLVFISRYYRLV